MSNHQVLLEIVPARGCQKCIFQDRTSRDCMKTLKALGVEKDSCRVNVRVVDIFKEE